MELLNLKRCIRTPSLKSVLPSCSWEGLGRPLWANAWRLPWGWFSGRDRPVHRHWSGEVNQVPWNNREKATLRSYPGMEREAQQPLIHAQNFGMFRIYDSLIILKEPGLLINRKCSSRFRTVTVPGNYSRKSWPLKSRLDLSWWCFFLGGGTLLNQCNKPIVCYVLEVNVGKCDHEGKNVESWNQVIIPFFLRGGGCFHCNIKQLVRSVVSWRRHVVSPSISRVGADLYDLGILGLLLDLGGNISQKMVLAKH